MFTEPEPVRLAIELGSRLGLDPDSSPGTNLMLAVGLTNDGLRKAGYTPVEKRARQFHVGIDSIYWFLKIGTELFIKWGLSNIVDLCRIVLVLNVTQCGGDVR